MARRSILAAFITVTFVSAVFAQQRAEEAFADALSAFESEDYNRAYAGFLALYEMEAAHNRTAALLMAGKSLYRRGSYQESIDLLARFRSEHPGSSYLAEAEQVMAYARLRLRSAETAAGALRLGVALPLGVRDPSATQALFNGIRIAVEQHNQSGGPPVQIIFRDTHRSRGGAPDAVKALAGQGVDAIIGPLYSGDVKSAAPVAEQAGVVMVAPLANAEDVTRGWRHIFQANPTFAGRGRFVAQQAVQRLGYRTLGIVSEVGKGRSAEMARGFEEEALAQGAEVLFHLKLSSPQDWMRIPDLISADTLHGVGALYLPVHRPNASEEVSLVEAILSRLGRVAGAPHILGTELWADVSVSTFASRLDISYGDIFHVRRMRPDVRAFQRSYRMVDPGQAPGRLGYVGHDVASFLIAQMMKGGSLVWQVAGARAFEGLGTRIRFDENHQNTAMYLLHLDAQGSRLAW